MQMFIYIKEVILNYRNLYVNLLKKHGSVRIAGRVHEVAHNMISRRCKSTAEKYKDYFYVDGLG